MTKFDTIEDALKDIKDGKPVIVVDDESRENEGDFIMAAEHITAEWVNFFATKGRGLICTPITREIALKLDLYPMVMRNSSVHETAFTVSIDHKDTETGISAEDRYLTIKTMTEATTTPDDYLRPGHIFPLIAKNGGVLERDGHTEASVDLCRLADLQPVGVICEIMNEDGSMARVPELRVLADALDFKLITIKDLIEYRKEREFSVKKETSIPFPTKYGEFDLHTFVNSDGKEVIAISKGEVTGSEKLLTRVHSECLTGDIFGSSRCDCGDQLDHALSEIQKKGEGLVVYLRQEGRGIGLVNKIKAYQLQDEGHDTVSANEKLGFSADLRTFKDAAAVLKYFNIKSIELLTNNPKKIEEIESLGISVSRKESDKVFLKKDNERYLEAKRDKMGHMILQNLQ